MLIKISTDIQSFEEMPSFEASNLFAELLSSSIAGNNLIVIPRRIASWAHETLDLSLREQAHLKKLSSEYSQIGALADAFPTCLTVLVGSQDLTLVSPGEWSIGHENLLASRLLDRMVLLLENATNDGVVYKKLIDLEFKRRRLGKPSYQIANGGGGTTFQELSRLIEEGLAVVCVCDHDRIAPQAQASSTYRRAEVEGKKYIYVGDVLPTPAREVENFFPPDMLGRLFPEYSTVDLEKLQLLIQRQGTVAPGDCLWLYFDIKEGISGEKILQKCKSPASLDWISKKYQVLEEEIPHISYPAFGSKVVETAVGSHEEMAELHRFVRSTYWKTHFSHWFNLLLPYVIGRQPSRL